MLLSTVKGVVFACNVICLLLGVGFIAVCTYGLECSKTGTDEHTYFIVGIILGAFICLTALIGCYGVCGDHLAVVVIYGFFMLMLLIIQYLQMRTFQPHAFHRNIIKYIHFAWSRLQAQSSLMQSIERNYNCCGLYNSRDYNYLSLSAPSSCYANEDAVHPGNLHACGCLEAVDIFINAAVQRDRLYNWALIVCEGLLCFCSMILSIILFHRYNRRHRQTVTGYMEHPPNNHTNRSQLLENY